MNIELHEHLMRVTVDTFKKETDKLEATVRARDAEIARLRRELFAPKRGILGGYDVTGWGPSLPGVTQFDKRESE
jgi:hypothetical protein